jgi:hypothetical protein
MLYFWSWWQSFIFFEKYVPNYVQNGWKVKVVLFDGGFGCILAKLYFFRMLSFVSKFNKWKSTQIRESWDLKMTTKKEKGSSYVKAGVHNSSPVAGQKFFIVMLIKGQNSHVFTHTKDGFKK